MDTINDLLNLNLQKKTLTLESFKSTMLSLHGFIDCLIANEIELSDINICKSYIEYVDCYECVYNRLVYSVDTLVGNTILSKPNQFEPRHK